MACGLAEMLMTWSGMCRHAFDRLTDLSNLLLENGDYHVHSTSREALQAELQRYASGIPSSSGPDSLQSQTGVAEGTSSGSSNSTGTQQDIGDANGWRAFAARIQASLSAWAAAGQLPVQVTEESEAPPAAAAVAPADPEENIFAMDAAAAGSPTQPTRMDSTKSAEEQEGEAGAPSTREASKLAADAANKPMAFSAAEQSTENKHADGDSNAHGAVKQGMGLQTMDHEAQGPQLDDVSSRQYPSQRYHADMASDSAEACQVDQASVQCSAAESPFMDGFEYDAASGYYYNSLMGAYYDPHQQLFGDASSGQWFSLMDGKYQLVT